MPFPLMPIALGIGALGSLWGARNQDKTNDRNFRAQQQARNQFMQYAMPYLNNQGPGQGEQMLLQFLEGANFDPESVFNNEAFNTGQDALMQMMRSDPYDTTELFQSFEPIEARALDQSLADFWGGSAGLGQRFGSAALRQEGQVRGEAAENAASRRQQIAAGLFESAQGRRQQAATSLAGLGLQGGSADQQAALQAAAQQMQGMGMLGGMENNRMGQMMQLLGMVGGFPPAMQQPGAGPAALGDLSQLMMLLPFLQGMGGQGA